MYAVRVVVDRPIWMDKVFTEECVVMGPMNLNSNPSARLIFFQHLQDIDKLFNRNFIDSIFSDEFQRPSYYSKDKWLYPLGCFFCCSARVLEVDTSIPKSGYALGQSINVAINVHNESDKIVVHVNYSLRVIKTNYFASFSDFINF